MEFMKLTTTLKKSGSSHFIPLSEENALAIMEKFGKRVLCKINGNSIHCALLNSKKRGYYIMVGKSTLQKIKAKEGDRLKMEIEKDESTYQAALPEELEVVLHTDPDGMVFFQKLTPGKQRSLIHMVGKAKQSDTRINRAIRILEKLKMGYTDLKDLLGK